MKKYTKPILIGLLILGLFYWYEIRPSQAEKYCTHWAMNKAINIDDGTYDQKEYSDYYQRCLRERGI